MMRLRLAFMGTPDFAQPALAALLDAGHDVVCVYAQPPRPAGRGQKLRPSPVQAYAESRRIAVRTPKSLRGATEAGAFAALRLDAAVVAAYGLILPQAILDAPRLGCINIHASLLPRWRGAAPIQRAIMAGDTETGIVTMLMDIGLDTGPTLLREATPIGAADTGGDLHDRLANIGAKLIVPTLDGLADGSLQPTPQPDAGVAYAHKLEKSDGRIDWSAPATALERQVRALAPLPRAWTRLGDIEIKVGAAVLAANTASVAPGVVLDDALLVQTGAGALRLTQLQRPGKAMMAADAFLRGFPVAPGARFGG